MNPILREFNRAQASLVYRAQEYVLRRPTFRLLRELRSSAFWMPGELETLQCARLNTLLRTSLSHSPWHAARIRAAGLEARVLAGAARLDDLSLLPTMDKRDARENQEGLVWREVPGGVFRYTTGGSSGQPLIFYYGRTRQAADAASRMAARLRWGVLPGDREAYLWGAPVELGGTDRVKRIRDRAVNHLLLNAFNMTTAHMDEYLATLETWQPRCLYGYASSLALLAAHALSRGATPALTDLLLVCTTGEPLLPYQREIIAKAFGAPVANEYGCRDGGLIAHELPGGLMRVMSEFVIVELLDAGGYPVEPGEPGEVTVTHLCSFAQPFIRYRTGDVAVADIGSSGKVTHGLREIQGRQTDFIIAADGTVMHALAVIYEVRGVEGVDAFKCIQHRPGELHIKIVPNGAWNDAAHRKIEAGMRARLGSRSAIVLELVSEIPPETSGKHRYVVSLVDAPSHTQHPSPHAPETGNG